MTEPTVSIIVPAFNAAHFLEATIERLLAQTLTSFEIVLVDDGSTDATPHLGTLLAAQHDRLRYVRIDSNGGVAGARKVGLGHSRGEFVWFVDADDSAPPSALERLHAAARFTGADVVIGTALLTSRQGATRWISTPALTAPVPGQVAFGLLLTGKITGHLWNKLIRRTVATGIDFTPAAVHSDLAMMGQLLAASTTVVAIPDVVYEYRLRDGSILHSGRRRDESLRLLERAFLTAALRAGPAVADSPEFRYFLLRYIVLSGVKDALQYRYDPAQRRALLERLRARLTWREIAVCLSVRDFRRLVLACTAKLSLPVHRLMLRLAASQ